MIRYSFVIPHRDIPALLEKCVASIPRRDDVEIIVVDDCSAPSAELQELLDAFAAAGVCVIADSSGKGAGHARNLGVTAAKGEWLLFADADDVFETDILAILDSFRDAPLDLVLFKTQCRKQEDRREFGSRQAMCAQWNAMIDQLSAGSDDKYYRLMEDFVVPWGKMVRRQFLLDHSIMFENVPFSNDVVWSILVLIHLRRERFACSGRLLYCVIDRPGSLSGNDTAEAFLCRSAVFFRKHAILEANGVPDMDPVNYPVYFRKAQSYGPCTLLKFWHLARTMAKKIPPVYAVERRLRLRYPDLFVSVLFLQSCWQRACR